MASPSQPSFRQRRHSVFLACNTVSSVFLTAMPQAGSQRCRLVYVQPARSNVLTASSAVSAKGEPDWQCVTNMAFSAEAGSGISAQRWLRRITAPWRLCSTSGSRFGGHWYGNGKATFAAETVAVVAATWCLAQQLQEEDVVLFVDNEAAAAALIRGSSRQEDVGEFVHMAHILWLQKRMRVWIEWLDSDSNPADSLSRGGLMDAWTQCQGWLLEGARQPPWEVQLSGAAALFGKDIGFDIGLDSGR